MLVGHLANLSRCRFSLPDNSNSGSIEFVAQSATEGRLNMEGQEPRTYQAKLDASGRIVLPSEVRQRHHWTEGDAVVLVDDDRGVVVRSLEEVVKEAQGYFRSVIPAGISLADELIAERREEAARE